MNSYEMDRDGAKRSKKDRKEEWSFSTRTTETHGDLPLSGVIRRTTGCGSEPSPSKMMQPGRRGGGSLVGAGRGCGGGGEAENLVIHWKRPTQPFRGPFQHLPHDSRRGEADSGEGGIRKELGEEEESELVCVGTTRICFQSETPSC